MAAKKKRPLEGKKIPKEQLRTMGPSRDVEGSEPYVVSEPTSSSDTYLDRRAMRDGVPFLKPGDL